MYEFSSEENLRIFNVNSRLSRVFSISRLLETLIAGECESRCNEREFNKGSLVSGERKSRLCEREIKCELSPQQSLSISRL